MKKIILLFLLAFTFGCDKNDEEKISQLLPPATQTGKGTFACYVNGKPFIDTSGGWFNCYYQFVDGAYYFSIGSRSSDNSNPRHLYIQTEKKEISEGQTYELLTLLEGNAYAGGGFVFGPTEGYIAYTNSDYKGELTITKLDFESNIVSGTFWFDIEHPITGEIIKIREGRFDTLFTE